MRAPATNGRAFAQSREDHRAAIVAYLSPSNRRPRLRKVIAAALVGQAERMRGLIRECNSADPKSVHELRKAIRDLRAQLRLFRPWLKKSWVRQSGDELRWFASELGAVRDLDVLRQYLNDRRAPSDVIALAQANLHSLRGELSHTLCRGLHSERLERLVRALDLETIERVIRAPNSERARKLLRGRVARMQEKIEARVGDVAQESTDEALHEIRKRAKDLRAAIETLRSIESKKRTRKLGRTRRSLKQVLDVLGARQDAVMMRTSLKRIAADQSMNAQVKTLFTKLSTETTSEIAAADRAFREAWPQFRNACSHP